MMCILIYCTYSVNLPALHAVCAFLSGALITGAGHQISCNTASYHLQPSLTQYPKQINFKLDSKTKHSETLDVK